MYELLKSSSVCLDFAVREHLENASQFLKALHSTLLQFESNASFDDFCRRCEANLDALRIAGERAINIGRTTMEDDAEAASVVALLLAECDSVQPQASEQAVAMLGHKCPEIRQAAWWGLRLASFRHVEPLVRTLTGKHEWDFSPAAALDILAFHRLPVQADLGEPQNEESEEVAWLLAEAGGRMRGVWTARHMKQFVGHASLRVREAALRASARCGILELLPFCRKATTRLGPAEAIEFLGVVGCWEDFSCLKRAVANQPVAKAAVSGLGKLGVLCSVPFLLDLMESPELAEPAASAFWRITGQEVPRGPAPDPPPGLSEDELDLWESQPPVDVSCARDWWRINASRFDPVKRYQLGLNVSDDPLGSVFDQLPLSIRYDVYLRERAITSGTPDWELETWMWKHTNPTG